jgi:hypothetical protein
MAYALVSNRADGLGQNGGTSGAINSTGANLIVLAVGSYQPTALAAGDISDSQSNAWTMQGQYSISSNNKISLFYKAAPTTNASHTFTVTKTDCYAAICVAAFSGAHASPFDDEDGGDNAGLSAVVSPATGITPAANNALVISALTMGASHGALTEPTGFTLLNTNAYVDSVSFGVSMAYDIQGTAAATDPEWTASATTVLATVVASFLEAVGGGVSIPVIMHHLRQQGIA